METDSRTAEYAVHYCKVDAFREDLKCQLTRWVRKCFKTAAQRRGLDLVKASWQFANPHDEKGQQEQEKAEEAAAGAAGLESRYLGFRGQQGALLREAEVVMMELPLKDMTGHCLAIRGHDDTRDGLMSRACCRGGRCGSGGFRDSDKDEEPSSDIICTTFIFAKMHLFFGGPDIPLPLESVLEYLDSGVMSPEIQKACNNFPLTGSQRIYLTHSILQSIDISEDMRAVLKDVGSSGLFCPPDSQCRYCQGLAEKVKSGEPIVLEHLREAGIYPVEFAMHDSTRAERPRCCDFCCCPGACCCCCCGGSSGQVDTTDDKDSEGRQASKDLRLRLSRAWDCCFRFQPLDLIRLYFGEKQAFYYAWTGFLIWCLIFLTIVGLACLAWGFAYAAGNYNRTAVEQLFVSQLKNVTKDQDPVSFFLLELTEVIRLIFENHLTIAFGLILTLWSLTVTETWRMYENRLSYRWDVNNWHLAEPERPVYLRRNFCPERCGQNCWKEPKDCVRRLISLSTIICGVAIVAAVVISVQVTEIVASGWHCKQADNNAAVCLILATLLPIGAHVVLIKILEGLYSWAIQKVNNIENHKYPSDHERWLAIKEFAFRFANNYTVLFYLAFAQDGGIVVSGFRDSCGFGKVSADCFSHLNIMATVYIVFKSALSSFLAVVMPFLKSSRLFVSVKRRLRLALICCCSCGPCLRNQLYSTHQDSIADQELKLVSEFKQQQQQQKSSKKPDFIEFAQQRHMSNEKDHVEYLDKLVLYGFMALFGSACFVAPAAVLISMAIDLRLDTRRLIFHYRRPVPEPAGGIGVWSNLLDFIGYVGIFTTAAILAFTSKRSFAIFNQPAITALTLTADPDSLSQLTVFIVFVSVVFGLKFILVVAIRGTSTKMKMRLKWEHAFVPKLMAYGKFEQKMMRQLDELKSTDECHYNLLAQCSGGCGNRSGSTKVVPVITDEAKTVELPIGE